MASFDATILGRIYDAPSFRITAEQIRAYGAATNDETPAVVRGAVAPAVFAVVPLRPAIRALLSEVTPLYEQLGGLHGEEDIFVHEPLEAGMVVKPRASLIGIRQRRTGTSVIAKGETIDEAGRLVNEQFITLYFPGAEAGESLGVDAPDHRLSEDVRSRPPDRDVKQATDHDQPVRYAAASGDTGRYHLEEEAALAVGLPGIIMHGMCTMAFAARAIVELAAGSDPASLRRIAVRFTRPVRPGDELTTHLWQLDGNGSYGFETRDGDGELVLGAGRAEIANAGR